MDNPSKARVSTVSTIARSGTSLDEEVSPHTLLPLTTLGRGSYGKVVLAQINADHVDKHTTRDVELVAVKIVAKSRLKTRGQIEKAHAELSVMKDIAGTSPFLLHSRGAFQTEDCLIYIMPYSSGGELFFHLQREGRFSEHRTRCIAMQVCLGLEHLHAHGVLYRDLKPENVLISPEGRCQLADFGLSKFLPRVNSAKDEGSVSAKGGRTTTTNKLASLMRRSLKLQKKAIASPEPGIVDAEWGTTRTKCGTPAYQAIEIVLAKDHSLEVDWWALGVLIYELLVGEPPFFANTVREVYDLILANNPTYPKKVSDRARSLISQLLTNERTQRLGHGRGGIQKIKDHPFFVEAFTEAKTAKRHDPVSWESSKLSTIPVIPLQETGIVGSPKDAVFFHSDYTSLDVREYIVPGRTKLEIEGFVAVPNDTFALFVSDSPIPVVVKDSPNNQDDNDLGKPTKN